ncbi:ribosomal protection-like ABC-F family protein [Pontibacter burrus]|uniref:ABC-F family ATP-binding cassette domain-containing protein n=1 Tax=Pontibacter burrus TaxID=2704466 RepID=A0A6B3LYI3_9BACT|nr:ABC-F family ATP-binding cassette domain-containing protein [Pontibacter burrus]NEM98514.1 ABC-F family ATP-binding cassette domain-containing protein [Pontibacter burrus]
MLILQNVSYLHPDKDLLFDNINLTLNRYQKAALIGHNGVGKSTLLQLAAGVLSPSGGLIKTDSPPYYIPQLYGQYNQLTIAQALRIDARLQALQAILDGNVTEENLTTLNDDWAIEERCREALQYWQLSDLDLNQKIECLSGGQKTKVFLAAIAIHKPELVLLDEPSNHLDVAGRELLYNFISASNSTILVVSHDRKLLNLPDTVFELRSSGITVYGGNYSFYQEQKQLQDNALVDDVKSKEKALRKAREVERASLERQQKLDARGKKKQEKAGMPTIMLNTLKNNAEKSTSRLKGIHAEKVGTIAQELHELRKELPDLGKMRLGFEASDLHKGKVLVTATNVHYSYSGRQLWQQPLSFQITSGERIALKGLNGSGKTTLIKLITGALEPATGTLQRADSKAIYIDQDYSLIDNRLSIYEQAQNFNITALQEHEVKIRLNRFLFTKEDWEKPCCTLSGGEKMRLMLCCLTIASHAPDLMILDEPTNNLDIQNMEILTSAINNYSGTLLVVSHDQYFLEQINIQRTIEL